MNRATEFLGAAAEPSELFFCDAVLLRIAGLHISLFQLLEPRPILAALTGVLSVLSIASSRMSRSSSLPQKSTFSVRR